jgi:hypothetical protein
MQQFCKHDTAATKRWTIQEGVHCWVGHEVIKVRLQTVLFSLLLYLIITHEVCFSQLISFLPLFCNYQFWRLDLIQFCCSQAHIPAGWRPKTWLFTLFCSVEFFFLTSLHWPHRKHCLLLSHIVLGMFTAPLYSNGCSVVHLENSLCVVEACLPSHCLAVGTHITLWLCNVGGSLFMKE